MTPYYKLPPFKGEAVPQSGTDEGYNNSKLTMDKSRNHQLNCFARKLRREMTREEKQLWYQCLKNLPSQFYRQRVFDNYIADFYCPSKKLVIEVDGSQHYYGEVEASDIKRDEYFRNMGITVMRFSNLQINTQFESVKNTIYEFIK